MICPLVLDFAEDTFPTFTHHRTSNMQHPGIDIYLRLCQTNGWINVENFRTASQPDGFIIKDDLGKSYMACLSATAGVHIGPHNCMNNISS